MKTEATTIFKVMYRNAKTGVMATLPEKSNEIKGNNWNFQDLENTARMSAEEVQDGTYIPVTATLRVELISQVDKKVVRKQQLTDEVFTFMRGDKIYNYKVEGQYEWKAGQNFEKDHYTSQKSLLKAFSDDRKRHNLYQAQSRYFPNNHRYNVITKGTEEEKNKSFFQKKAEEVPIYVVKVTRRNGEYKILDKKLLSDFPEILI